MCREGLLHIPLKQVLLIFAPFTVTYRLFIAHELLKGLK